MKSFLLVADVLGFSNIVSNLSHDNLSERMGTWVSLVEETRDETGIKRMQLVSDTIFAQENDSEDEVKRLFGFSKLLLERGMKNSFPIRGAITYGEVSWKQDMIYGKAVVEANRLERSLDWIGIACGRLPKIPWSWDLACTYPVPRKTGKIETLPSIVWAIPTEIELFEKSTDGGLIKDHNEIVRWESQSKRINTNIFSKYVSHAKQAGLAPSEFNLDVPSHFNVTSNGVSI